GGDESTRIAVSVSGLTLSHGHNRTGAGIRNAFFSNLTLSGVVLSNNKTSTVANSSSFGGAIANVGDGAILNVLDSTLVNNTADASGGRFGEGGAIFSVGTSVTVTR